MVGLVCRAQLLVDSVAIAVSSFAIYVGKCETFQNIATALCNEQRDVAILERLLC